MIQQPPYIKSIKTIKSLGNPRISQPLGLYVPHLRIPVWFFSGAKSLQSASHFESQVPDSMPYSTNTAHILPISQRSCTEAWPTITCADTVLRARHPQKPPIHPNPRHIWREGTEAGHSHNHQRISTGASANTDSNATLIRPLGITEHGLNCGECFAQ